MSLGAAESVLCCGGADCSPWYSSIITGILGHHPCAVHVEQDIITLFTTLPSYCSLFLSDPSRVDEQFRVRVPCPWPSGPRRSNKRFTNACFAGLIPRYGMTAELNKI